jgi:hypothetical protein
MYRYIINEFDQKVDFSVLTKKRAFAFRSGIPFVLWSLSLSYAKVANAIIC